ncbi:MAG TPA: CHASE3 domain-containing protein [Stellaceae bacterium]|jgi:signal transduction histidine kinase/CheY-like chemotaxis protein|nr:CHASE3 domain-containing protein [Stellaceae bacterium]
MTRRPSARSEIILALLFGAVPLAFIAGVVLFQMAKNVPDARKARADTVAAFATVRAVGAVDEAIQDAERGQRGYLLTARDDYLQPYLAAKQRLPQLMIGLQGAVAGDNAQQQRVLRLQSHVTTKLDELAATIAAMRQHGFEAAKSIVETDLGQQSMNEITGDLAAIGEVANAQLTGRLDTAADAEGRVTATFIFGSSVAALGLLVGALLLARAVQRATTSEATLLATLDSVREGVAAFDHRGRLRVWNVRFTAILGSTDPGLRADAPLPPGAAALGERLRDLTAPSRAAAQPGLSEFAGEEGRRVEIFHSPAGEGGQVVTLLDVTDRRKTEEILAQAQKLEALGRMTGGVAHDFNNLLTVIIGGLGLLRGSIAGDTAARQRVDMMSSAAERATRLIRQLLAFARRQPLQPDVVNLGPAIQEALPLIRRAVGENVTVEWVTGAGLWNTTVDATEFQAAVLNLAINGRDAMPAGGKLTIELGNAALDDAYAAQHAEVQPGQYVMFAITDTGTGMDAATLAQALDPFFTTKPPGEGTGLGLPQVYGFVKQSGGHLKIYSEPGEGTTVKLYLPRSLAQKTAARPVAAIAAAGHETVLLVDDDEIVRDTVALMLEDLGYAVIEAHGGAEALEILRRGDQIDLLFTDVVMPGPVSGRQLADEARTLDPGLRVLFTSGYTENAIVHHGRLDPGLELLSKPYGREQLAAKLRRVLDAPRKPPDSAAES